MDNNSASTSVIQRTKGLHPIQLLALLTWQPGKLGTSTTRHPGASAGEHDNGEGAKIDPWDLFRPPPLKIRWPAV